MYYLILKSLISPFFCFLFSALLAKEGNEHEKKVFETASKYHFYHTLALFAVPFCKFPKVVSCQLYVFCNVGFVKN